MTTIPATAKGGTHENVWSRNLEAKAAFGWLAAGWHDLTVRPFASLAYGFVVFLLTAGTFVGLFAYDWDFLLLPALSGFMLIGPVLAIGLYEQSRRIAAGEPCSLLNMLFFRPKSAALQVLLTSFILILLMAVWIRSAFLVYGVFFGLVPFDGVEHVSELLLGSPLGWSSLVFGVSVGGLFAAFSYSIGAFALPMQLDERVDVLTAMGKSLALVWHNLAAMLTWAAILFAGFLLCLATGFVGLIIVFPVLGHGTWHAYRAIKR